MARHDWNPLEMVTVVIPFLAAVTVTQGSVRYEDLSDGERYLLYSFRKSIEEVDTKLSRVEFGVETASRDLIRQQSEIAENKAEIKELNRFKDESTGRRAAELGIISLLTGAIMAGVNRWAAIASKKRGKG